MEKVWIHDYYLNYNTDDNSGLEYLRDELIEDEAKVFFNQAYERGEAQFEDRNSNRFSIVYKGGEYVLVRR